MSPTIPEIDTRGFHQLGELAVHRDSLKRILKENPLSLSVILDELLGALQKDYSSCAETGEFKASALCFNGRYM
jgi:hypothetical protein